MIPGAGKCCVGIEVFQAQSLWANRVEFGGQRRPGAGLGGGAPGEVAVWVQRPRGGTEFLLSLLSWASGEVPRMLAAHTTDA